MKIKAAITHEKGTMSLEELELAPPQKGQVLVKMVACGVCHTDEAGINQLIPVALPAVFGHEGVGVVEELGPGVTSLKKGDRIIMTFPSCGVCDYCAEGHPYACDNINTLFFNGSYLDGTKRLSQNGTAVSSFFGQGAFATYAVADERNVVKADVASDDELAYLCSLGCGVQTGVGAVLNRLRPKKGSSIAVFGCGGVGMSAVMGAAIAGCGTIIAVDVAPSRLETAKSLGATHAVNGRECDAVEEIRKITKGGAQYSVESSGVPALTLQALNSLRRNGAAIVVSVTGPAEVSIALEPMLMNKSATLYGLTEGGSNPPIFIPELVKYYREGRLPIDKLVKFYKFEDIKRAFEDSHSGATIKPILRF
ncbi:MAG: NAD(P)-dependent alcohol dehydrogenase [Clostridiales Family XIII bacterium]|jgi:aryl-alcohol dehydrogenase|nr:NAD(P)-dependent alcohol dehydrogenase [Clostridiales Family XIII bacterium]